MKDKGEIIIYKTKDGTTSIDVKMEEGTAWLTQNQMVELFEKDKSVISRHIRNIYNEGELNQFSTVAKNTTVQKEGDLVALTLMIAESKSEEKDTMVKVVINLINKNN